MSTFDPSWLCTIYQFSENSSYLVLANGRISSLDGRRDPLGIWRLASRRKVRRMGRNGQRKLDGRIIRRGWLRQQRIFSRMTPDSQGRGMKLLDLNRRGTHRRSCLCPWVWLWKIFRGWCRPSDSREVPNLALYFQWLSPPTGGQRTQRMRWLVHRVRAKWHDWDRITDLVKKIASITHANPSFQALIRVSFPRKRRIGRTCFRRKSG